MAIPIITLDEANALEIRAQSWAHTLIRMAVDRLLNIDPDEFDVNHLQQLQGVWKNAAPVKEREELMCGRGWPMLNAKQGWLNMCDHYLISMSAFENITTHR